MRLISNIQCPDETCSHKLQMREFRMDVWVVFFSDNCSSIWCDRQIVGFDQSLDIFPVEYFGEKIRKKELIMLRKK